MRDADRRALTAVRPNWTASADDIWRQSDKVHAPGLHTTVADTVLDAVRAAERDTTGSPLGVVVQGPAGSGKTHLLGWLRRQVQQRGGYFFLVELLDASDFWCRAQVAMLDSLARPAVNGGNQLHQLLRNLASEIGVPRTLKRAVAGETPVTPEQLDDFVTALRHHAPEVGRECRHTIRALVLGAATDHGLQDIGDAFLHAQDEEEAGERAPWGIRTGTVSPADVVRQLSRILALTGPSLIAVDQLDTLIASSRRSTAGLDSAEHLLSEQIGHGLMALRQATRRTVTVVTCLPSAWELIKDRATQTVRDRFREAPLLEGIPDGKVGRTVVERHFAARYAEIGFTPPYPSWPVHPTAFADASEFTPRLLLQRVDQHIQRCLRTGELTELRSLTRPVAPGPSARPPTEDLDELDARYAALRTSTEVAAALDPASEDTAMPPLLAAGLAAWIAECDDPALEQDPPPSSKPALHARLRRTLDEATEDQEHWAFRAIAATHGNAALTRLRAACSEAGLADGVPQRRLFVLRNHEWSKGAATQRTRAAFERAGGRRLTVVTDDLRALAALRALQEENPPRLADWLAHRRPAHAIPLLQAALDDVPAGAPRLGSPGPDADQEERTPTVAGGATADDGTARASAADQDSPLPAEPSLPPAPRASSEPVAPHIQLGTVLGSAAPLTVPLEALRKHTAIFAGSGSGKTVLIRRLIEECALQGVSTIVLDPNNDLARLGTAWPVPPAGWSAGDATRASEYLAGTEVVVWTPRRSNGRPLSFQPLPDFAGVADDADEFDEAIEAAVAALAPRAGLTANTSKAQVGRAVLKEAMVYFGRKGRSRLRGFIDLLAELPDGVSDIPAADKVAAGLATLLTAAMVNDPLFGGGGAPVDPGVLLTPSPGRRARVSVISMIGLPSDDQRQSFVNQLQMALFAWVKRNPAADRPLGGLFVMDEAQTLAPSGPLTACTQSTLALASQARKYGLGLVFATQAPKGLHNRIPGNAATQFFGLLNSPIQIAAAKEMAKAKGSAVDDIARLRTGEFYAAVEGTEFRKTQTPLCLTHHPRDPLRPEEVVRLARTTGPNPSG